MTGPVGVGKSTILHLADELLVARGVAHASIELETLARSWPPGLPDAERPRLAWRNLAALWAGYQEAGADRLLLGLLLERRADLQPLERAVPGAEVTVVRLWAPLEVIEERARQRPFFDPEQEVSGARWWHERLQRATEYDHLVTNVDRGPREVAAEVLRLLGW